MNKKKYKKTKRKQLNRRKIRLLLLVIVVISFFIYNVTKPNSNKQTAETVTYQNANKIDKCIVIDAGHGGIEEPGCTFANVYEKTICLKIAEKLRDKLEKEYSRVIMTRTEDVNVYLNERARIANREKGDIFVSIHQNALEDDDITSGIETWYNPIKDYQSKKLAQIIQDNVINSTGANDLGIKDGKELIVIKNTEMPACLIETGFLSSTKERNKLITEEYQNKIVDGIYNGIKAYFEQEDENSENKNVNQTRNNV